MQQLAFFYIRSKFRILSAFAKKKAARQALKLFSTPLSRAKIPLPAVLQDAEPCSFNFEDNTVIGNRWNKDAAKKLLILHGFESTALNFAHFISPLIQKGYEVIAFDAPAHGRSSGKQTNAIQYKRFIIELNNRYGPFDAYLAHSLGCLSLSLALKEMKVPAKTKAVFIAAATSSATAANQFFKFINVKSPQVREEFDKLVFEEVGEKLAQINITKVLPSINASVLWIHDRYDKITPLSDMEELITTDSGSTRFIITEGFGHSRIYRDATVCRQVIDFF